MSQPTAIERFASELLEILDETFEHVHGIYLDRGTSLFETLATISAAEASRPVSARCASIAAQVYHVRFYLQVLLDYIEQREVGKIDWQASWQLEAVSPDEWEALKRELRATYQRVVEVLKGIDTWQGENQIGGALAIAVHTAYHLGEIRQALCTIK